MQQSSSEETPGAYLISQVGKRWTEVIRLNADKAALIGRSSQCDIVVNEDAVSRKHAEISRTPTGWVVRDLGSRNGTLLNQKRLEEPWKLSSGEVISVGSCNLRFTDSLSTTNLPIEPLSTRPAATSQNTVELAGASIVDRQQGSQWSIPTPAFLKSQSSDAADAAFFYGLVYDLVMCADVESCARAALDRLMAKLELSCGGILSLDPTRTKRSGQPDISSLEFLATRHADQSSYRCVSDFLLQSVVHDKQAILAKNVHGDHTLTKIEEENGKTSVNSTDGSVACAPIFESLTDREHVLGVVHVYTSVSERTLGKGDFDTIVAVADNLSIALAKLGERVALEESLDKSRRQIAELKHQLDLASSMVGTSKALEKVRHGIRKAAPTNATVLIRGESGVGKELVAREIHDSSMRSDAPMVCLNCAALAPTLLESELFGHEKGAFTGATDRKIGKFEAANQGTLFLDEIGEMPLELQAKFLRVLEGQPFERLGGHKPIKTDVRVVAATNRDLEDAVREKEFRSDLYYRLRVIELNVPPLRSRQEDIPLLAEYFMTNLSASATSPIKSISSEAIEILCGHSWPGNVRELRNVIERALVLGEHETLEREDLSLAPVDPSLLSATNSQESQSAENIYRALSLADLEREHIFSTLEHTGGNKSQASKILGIERSTLDRKLKRY